MYNKIHISVSLDNAAENCELPAYPGSSGFPAAVNYMESLGAVVACGGTDLSDSSKCWAFDGTSWTPLPDSTQRHYFIDSPNLVVDENWWVAGTLQTANGTCSYYDHDEWTSEVFNGEHWVQGPQKPRGFNSLFCLAQLNATHSLYTTDWTYNLYVYTWLYDWTAGEWIQTGDLKEGRFRHGCAVLDGLGVLVAGGNKNRLPGLVHSVELYDPEAGTWTLQPSLPQDIDPSAPTLLVWDGSVIALFRAEDQVYQRADDGTWSPLEGVVLPGTFYGYINNKAVIVPNDFANGCM